MKTNPLLLSNQKLHAATNLVFDEGVIRTRPGFRYEKTPASGQFQGAAEFRPRQGISSNRLSELYGGVVFVADGNVWAGCKQIGEGFFCKGDVNLFQAENYLILQCRETSTFWWDGVSGLVASSGMNEQDWNDPETPLQVIETVAPVADIPECDIDGSESGIEVRFLVIDHVTELPIDDVVWTVKRNGNRAYHGLSGSDGRFTFKPRPRVYAYDLRKDGYTAIEDVPLQIDGTGVERSWDECLPPTITLVGEYDFVARMVPVGVVEPVCSVDVSIDGSFIENTTVRLNFYVYGDYSETTESVVLTGSMDSGIFTGICSKGAITLEWKIGPSTAEEWVLSFDAVTPASGTGVLPNHEAIDLPTDRNSLSGFGVEYGGSPFPNWTATGDDGTTTHSAQFIITNNGNETVTITSITSDATVLSTFPEIPFEILAGASQPIAIASAASMSAEDVTFEGSCGEDPITVIFPS